MRLPRFKKWFAGLPALNLPQRRQVLEALRPAAGLDQLLALLEKFRADRCCPACAGTQWHRHGQANGLQRYRCRDCRRTFNDLSGTPLARLRLREKWIDYLGALLESLPVRRAADRVKVHRNTAFRWRHRFLTKVKDDRPQRLHGIVEADEMFLLESQKGSRQLARAPRKRGGTAQRRGISGELDCILVARDRSGQTVDAVTGRGTLKMGQLERHLLPVLDPQVLLVSDANAAYRAFSRRHGIAHQYVNLRAGERVRRSSEGAIHVQNVNSYHRRLRDWLARFHGVASRYLPNYLGWRRALDGGGSRPLTDCCASQSNPSIANGDSAFPFMQPLHVTCLHKISIVTAYRSVLTGYDVPVWRQAHLSPVALYATGDCYVRIRQ